MEAIAELIVPILIATVLCFILSSLIWMVFPHHKNDWIRSVDLDLSNAAEGQYVIPKDHMTADWYAFVFVKRGPHKMGKSMLYWFIQQLIISSMVAYILFHTTPRGSEYLQIFRIAGTAALLGYGGAIAHKSIWWGWRWSVTWKEIFDALLYALIVAGSFAFYWN